MTAARPDPAAAADARLARDHHAGMVRHYALAVRRRRLAASAGEGPGARDDGGEPGFADGGKGPLAVPCDDLLDELRHHRQRHRVFNRHLWRSIIPYPSG